MRPRPFGILSSGIGVACFVLFSCFVLFLTFVLLFPSFVRFSQGLSLIHICVEVPVQGGGGLTGL